MDEEKQRQPEDLDKGEAVVLPAREAMSIISPALAPPDPVPETGAAATGGENVGPEDQGMQASSNDSASSQT